MTTDALEFLNKFEEKINGCVLTVEGVQTRLSQEDEEYLLNVFMGYIKPEDTIFTLFDKANAQFAIEHVETKWAIAYGYLLAKLKYNL